jgi:hypothetical protein
MAQGLSLLVRVYAQSREEAVAGAMAPLSAEETANGSGGPNILHYVWAVPVPGLDDPEGQHSVLLTTVYDEDFDSYIRDLVLANPPLFNNAADLIVGLAELKPVQDNIPAFIQWVREHDLTMGGTLPFTQAYPYTVVQIQNALG